MPTPQIPVPAKPFSEYRWRWATLTPTEGLNEPPIYLGVLRVLAEHEGEPPSSPGIQTGLARVGSDVRGRVATTLRLDRDTARNLIRNSGQYWKALGLVRDTRGGIELTDLGRKVARGDVTTDEFAAATVKTLTMPNGRIESDISSWGSLEIKPLQLILTVIEALKSSEGASEAYLSPPELYGIVVPLAGAGASPDVHARATIAHRRGTLSLASWPDCTPGANDKRMAKEFLLFLFHYGYLRLDRTRGEERYYLEDEFAATSTDFLALAADSSHVSEVIAEVRDTGAALFAQRERVTAEVIARPGQAKFRRDVLAAYENKCLITKENVKSVLAACHIIPVENQGSDAVKNGICLRADIHNLFDQKYLRIAPDGTLHLSEAVRRSPGYANFPTNVSIPSFVDPTAIEWRWRYY